MQIRRTFLIGLLLLPFVLWGQEQIKPTNQFTISGKVKQEKVVNFDSLQQYSQHNIGNLTITNHVGVTKGVAKALKGVLLKDVLSNVELDANNPKQLSAFFFTCIASDGYTVVYSWNEIFNTATGEHTFVVTDKDGKPMTGQAENILMTTTSDDKTGRRFIKSLAQIVVSKAQ